MATQGPLAYSIDPGGTVDPSPCCATEPDTVEAVWPNHRPVQVLQWGGRRWIDRADAAIEEVPIALVYNGVSHAVMLAAPTDLGDFALGFGLGEGILGSASELYDCEPVAVSQGIELRPSVASARFAALKSRRRTLAGRTRCGLCGVESREAVERPPVRIARTCCLRQGAIASALAALPAHQRLFRLTGGGHAAAWIDAAGEVRLVREDVGRHNALDKLIGASVRAGARRPFVPREGFAICTSRASFEMVQRAMTAGIGLLVAVSAPTASAVRLAETAGIALLGFARGERMLVYPPPEPVINPT
jgi:FdhD protein